MDFKLLDRNTFQSVIDNTPLVSIDLIVRNSVGEILLGQRLNRPAQGFWFVPGGRILKNESLADAFKRLTLDELGVEIEIGSARYLGLYEHFYDDSIFTNESTGEAVTTHYVVNAFEIVLPNSKETSDLPVKQHGEYRWFIEAELMASDHVHKHSKWYFDINKGLL